MSGAAAGAGSGRPRPRPRVDVSRVGRYAPEHLVGREREKGLLRTAWRQMTAGAGGRPRVVTLVGQGGEGKTSLVAHWLAELAADDWAGCQAAFGWSFYSQGTRDESGASSDLFLLEALRFLGEEELAVSAAPADVKAGRLAELAGEAGVLLVLDGIEPLQYPPGEPHDGALRDRSLSLLVKRLAAVNRGLCVVTTRVPVPDLRSFRATTAPEHRIDRLTAPAGVDLLRRRGVTGPEPELAALVDELDGHALSIDLAGSYLRRAHGGRIAAASQLDLAAADRHAGGHAFRVIEAYVDWLEATRATTPVPPPAARWWRRLVGPPAPAPPEASAELQLAQLLGLFDRPMPADCLQALVAPPALPGLTGTVVATTPADRNLALSRLEEAGLVTVAWDGAAVASVDAHPLVRAYFADRLRRESENAWRAGHERLYHHLCAATDEGAQPTLDDLQPLYHAITHGCHAGLHQHASDTVYRDRICRGNEFYAMKKLGPVAADLAAVTAFFDTPFTHPNPTLTRPEQSWLTGLAGHRLRALGRSTDALPLFHTALTADITTGDRRNAAIYAGNLSELQITLGDLIGAATTAATILTLANHTTDPFEQFVAHTQLGAVHHQQGHLDTATTHFTQAETLQTTRQPSEPRLSSYQGFQYCELLGQPTETAAWHHHLNPHHPVPDLDHHTTTLTHLTQRADHALTIAQHNRWLLDIGLDTLTQARTTLHHHLLHTTTPTTTDLDHATHTVTTLRQANTLDLLPPALLTRAALHTVGGHHNQAITDLNEAWDLAQQGPMPLFEVDTLLHRTRLYGPLHLTATHPYPWPDLHADLDRATELIECHGYHRRDQELADTVEALAAIGRTQNPGGVIDPGPASPNDAPTAVGPDNPSWLLETGSAATLSGQVPSSPLPATDGTPREMATSPPGLELVATATLGEQSRPLDDGGLDFSEALAAYRRKLARFELIRAQTADPGRQFELDEQLDEIRGAIARLEGEGR